MGKKLEVYAGQKYGSLVVIREIEPRVVGKRKVRRVSCRCACGSIKDYVLYDLRKGDTKSCGCLRIKRSHERCIHGMSHTNIYRVRQLMISRCYCEDDPSYKNYGGRGISVCEDWLKSPVKFLEWAFSSGYSSGLTIDRIDNNGDYCPKNCRWVDRKTQTRNRRNTVKLDDGRVLSEVYEQECKKGITYDAFRKRIQHGWSLEKAMNTPMLREKK